jgi:hypothetical protein
VNSRKADVLREVSRISEGIEGDPPHEVGLIGVPVELWDVAAEAMVLGVSDQALREDVLAILPEWYVEELRRCFGEIEAAKNAWLASPAADSHRRLANALRCMRMLLDS